MYISQTSAEASGSVIQVDFFQHVISSKVLRSVQTTLSLMFATCVLLQTRIYYAQHSVGKGEVLYVGGKLRCIDDACSKFAIFGHVGEPPIYCKSCIRGELKNEVVDVWNKRCEVEGCPTQPSFGNPGDRLSALFIAVCLKK
jgi:hypothetical protein